MKSFKKIASLFLALCMAVSVFTVPTFAVATSVKDAISIGSTGDPVVKVLFDIPEGLENVVGIQFTVTTPEKFTIKSIESSVDGWEFKTNPSANSATIIMHDGEGATIQDLFLEKVSTANSEGLYELATLEMTPADDVAAGNYEISVLVEDITVYDPASDTEDKIANQENDAPVIRTFEYTAHSHDWDEGVVTIAPTCKDEGERTFTCGSCGETKKETIKVNPHKFTDLKAVAATCTTAGKTAGKKCSVCGYESVKQTVIPVKSHTIVAIPAKAATYTATGLTAGKKCSVCNTVTVKQTVTAKLPQTSLKKAKFTLKAKTYTGKAIKQSFKVKLGSKTLTAGVDYTVSYKNNKKIGKATVTITGIGAYKDSVKKTFKINPKKLSGLKVKAGKKQMTVSWKKNKSASGYEIVYATSKNFKKGKKTIKVTKAKTVKKVIKKLKAKKTYYVKVRAYKTVKKSKYYSSYTSAKKVKVK